RLTLNVLLSFAQFEREIAGERIRDKFRASKRNGLWICGSVPLGYDRINREVVINNSEAKTVRKIFRKYMEIGTLKGLARYLNKRNVLTKYKKLKSGGIRGGGKFSDSGLGYMLRNRVYLGEFVFEGRIIKGPHQPIIKRELFDLVQLRLALQRERHGN